MRTVSFSPDQRRAIDAIEEFIASSRRFFVLHGLAGTGKTTVLAEIARRYPNAILCAFTGKAASVLRTRTGLPVSTIHSIIYDFKGLAEDEFDPTKKNPIFIDKEQHDLAGRLVLVDESSCVGQRLAHDLLETGARVVACGDPGQLPPVMDAQFFTDPDLTLENIHRQAWNSPIIRQAHAIRAGRNYAPDTEAFSVTHSATEAILSDVDVALCWRNRSRLLLNQRRREALGIGDRTAVLAGEPLMCLKNDHTRKIYNGAIYTCAWDRHLGEDLVIDDDGRAVEVMNPLIEGIDSTFEEMRHEDGYVPFALAYAATVHKAQGSEWRSVLLVDECRTEERRRLLYTGVTRAIERVVVVKW